MTSNIPGGRPGAEIHFKPEFINRLDDIVEFDALSREDIRVIVGLQIERVAARVRERGIELVLTPAALDLLGELGYDPTYGARPLKRVAAEAARRPAGARAARGRVPRGRHRRGRRGRRRAAS